LQMTVDGLGIACLPESMVRNELREKRLVPLRYPWVPDALSFCARYDADNTPSYVGQAALLAGELSARSVLEGVHDPN
jgi:DNA-binding transcriptional LysR family regulator